jgi:pimeloyl-ACP methyl ester carboxylesterase
MSRYYLQVGEYQAAYQITGDGPPMILLHGFLGNGDNWQPLCSDLASSYQCITLDLLGFGQSSKPELKYTIWHQVEFLRQFVQAMQLAEFHLVGHSYGGWLAAAYTIAASGVGWDRAMTQWKSVASLSGPGLKLPMPQTMTLIAPAGIRDDRFVGRYTYMKPLLWNTPLVDWTLAAMQPLAALVGQANALLQINQARIALREQPVAKSFLLDRLRPEDAIDTVEALLEHIPIPTLVIAGQQDTTIPLWHCETYACQIPAAQIQIFADAAHNLIQTHHTSIAALIQQRSNSVRLFS